MPKHYIILMSVCIFLALFIGCTHKKTAFNDENIIFSLEDYYSSDEYQSYTIKLTNETGYELTHLILNLSYPIKTDNGSKGNPFVINGTPENRPAPLKINHGESIHFSISAPIKEVFANNNLLDFENPTIELKGFIKDSNIEIPFGRINGLKALIEDR